MNYGYEMEQWLKEQRGLIDSQAKQWFDMAVAGKVSEEESLRNIHELIIQRRTLDKVQTKLAELDTIAANEAEEAIVSAFGNSEEEDGCDDFSWEEDEKEIILPFPDEE